MTSLSLDDVIYLSFYDVIDSYVIFQNHQFSKEAELIEKREELLKQLEPYHRKNPSLQLKSDNRALLVQYGILAYMVGMWGVLFRLTWWEYSWDIMEPVTYFITFS